MPHSTRQLDVRNLPCAGRHAQVFGTFAALGSGEAFVLVNDHDPKPLLHQFQAEFPGAFEWSVLEAGPERFRVEIRRRDGAPTRTVSDYLETDHQRLDDILPEIERLTGEGALARAGERFKEFACGLNRHIDAEERILFPSFEELTGMTMGPTVVMRAEHVEIRRWMEAALASLVAEDATGFKQAIGRLTGVLAPHNMKEEQILYPMTDRAVATAADRDDLVKRMQLV